MTTATTNAPATLSLPAPGWAHWLIRLPVAGTFLYHGLPKFADLAGGAEWIGLPVAVWTLVALGETFAGLGILAGGALKGTAGDLLTRAAGASIAIIMAGAVFLVHLGPWSGMEFQVLLLAAGLFFALRGNRA